MKRLSIVSALGFLALATSANAGTLVVSGDSNLGNALDGDSGSTIVAGNPVFFANLLGSGTVVDVQQTTNGDPTETGSESAIENYYTGHGDTVTTSAASAASLASANLFIGFLQDTAYTAAETTAIANFLNGGGTVLLTAEWVGFDAGSDAILNALLTALGSPMQIVPASYDLGFQIATGSQIASNELTAGVTSFGYAATSGVTGGTVLFNTVANGPFMECTGCTATSSAPEPSTLLLALGGLGGLLALGRRASR